MDMHGRKTHPAHGDWQNNAEITQMTSTQANNKEEGTRKTEGRRGMNA
jgi:hypothetical protein